MNDHGPQSQRVRAGVLGALLLVLGACGGAGTGSSDGTLSTGVGQTRAHYQVLDLASGRLSARGAIGDLATNPLYRSSQLVFRLVDRGGGSIGTPSTGLGAALDPAAAHVGAAPFYLAVFETTQAQWQLLAASSPWTQLASLDGSGDVQVGDDYPAVGISRDLASAAVASYRGARGVTLALPGDDQWEVACRAGGSATWAWGEASDLATISAAAVVWESAGSSRGARPVGQRSANALGLFDMHGNVAELTSAGTIRGGSWNDPVTTARAASRPIIDPATRHLLVGVRLVYVP